MRALTKEAEDALRDLYMVVSWTPRHIGACRLLVLLVFVEALAVVYRVVRGFWSD